MSISWLTSCIDLLADDLSLKQARYHLLNQALDQNEFNSQKRLNHELGRVISNSQTADFPQAEAGGRSIAVKVRLESAQGSFLPFFGDGSFTATQSKIIRSCHGTAVSDFPLDNKNGERVPRFGEKVVCLYAEEAPDFYGRMRDLRYKYPASSNIDAKYVVKDGVNWDGSDLLGTAGVKNPWGLKPKKGIYNGIYLPAGTKVLNGYPIHGKTLLKKASTTYFKPGNSQFAMLADHLKDFEDLAAAFSAHFSAVKGKPVKFSCTGYRSFKRQISVRKDKVASEGGDGSCSSMTVAGRSPCKTARPGTSKHGWGIAIDILRIDRPGKFLNFSSEEYDWMVLNAEKYNFHHPQWARKKSDGGSNPEAWHWEVKNPVISV